MKIKNKLKSFKSLYALNASLKALLLKYNYKHLSKKYAKLYQLYNLHYSEMSSVSKFVMQHKTICPGFRAKQKGELSIFWVGTSFNQDNSGFLQALKTFGNLEVFHNHLGEYGVWNNFGKAAIYDSCVVEKNSDALRKQIEKCINKKKPDLLIGQMWAGRISSEVLQWVRKQGIPVMNISMDDRLPQHWGYHKGIRLGSVGLGSGVDIVLTTSSECCKWYWVEGMNSIFMPLASCPQMYLGDVDASRDIDVLFIGNKYGIREKIIETLRNNGFNVCVFGSGWQNGVADFKKSIEFSRRAKIILGVGTVGHCDNLYTLKLRDFDAPMAGALYITHRNPDLAKMFGEGVDMEFYETIDELVVKLNKYLKDNTSRLNIANNGHNLAIRRDSWDSRLTNLFSLLGFIPQ